MGCASSKHRKRCRNCRGELSPVVVPRSYSMKAHQPSQDSHRAVALTSSSVGSQSHCDSSFKKQNLQDKLVEAKVWSSMMNEKISKTPMVTPPGEPEMINTWELMEGLEDVSPDVCVAAPPKSTIHVKSNTRLDDLDRPEIISSFRKSLQQLPPRLSLQTRIPDPPLGSSEEEDKTVSSSKREKVILYFTSLRGIRKTYEDSCNVRIILKSLGVRLDERDVSMHSGFRDELKKLLKDKSNGVGITLPRVFLGNKYIGGAEEINKFNENGTLEKLIQDCEKVEDGFDSCGNECEACGDVRFVPCETCSGSCKVYEKAEETKCGFQRCPDCNENGLIRCPTCC